VRNQPEFNHRLRESAGWPAMRIRIFYQKTLPLRFTSALDLQRIWERSLRRADLRIMYSQGFHPQPKIQLGIPLPLGFISDDECVDIWLENEVICDHLIKILEPNVPDGILINDIIQIEDHASPVVTTITVSEYLVKFWSIDTTDKILQVLIDDLLQQTSILRVKRKGKQYDLRPLILELRVSDKTERDSGYHISMKIVSKPNQTGRADEVLLSMGFVLNDFLVKKVRSY
jgi:radical SAM-linked protein